MASGNIKMFVMVLLGFTQLVLGEKAENATAGGSVEPNAAPSTAEPLSSTTTETQEPAFTVLWCLVTLAILSILVLLFALYACIEPCLRRRKIPKARRRRLHERRESAEVEGAEAQSLPAPRKGSLMGAEGERLSLYTEADDEHLSQYMEAEGERLSMYTIDSYDRYGAVTIPTARLMGACGLLAQFAEFEGAAETSTEPLLHSQVEKSRLQHPGSLSTPPTHLQRILEEHGKFAAGFSEDYLKDNTFQLPYIAIGYFDQEGGSLSLRKYNVHLYVPRGALPKGRLQQVYIYVNPSAPAVNGIASSECVLSPMVQCGPADLKFMDSVVLSFPHFAVEDSGWELRAQICHNDQSSPKTWKNLEPNDDGKLVSTKDKNVVLLLKHFTGAALVGEPSSAGSTKRMEAGVFGKPFDPSHDQYPFRIHLWNDEPVVKQKVMDMETKLGAEQLDVERLLLVRRSGDVCAELENIKRGWQLAIPALQKQTIPAERVWEFPMDSVTFDLERKDLNEAPSCDAFIGQLSTEEAQGGGRIRFSVRPPKREPKVETDKKIPCFSCRSDTARVICPSCQEAMKCFPVPKNLVSSDGDYGGLTEGMVRVLYVDPGTNRELLRLAGVEDDATLATPDALKVVFARKRARDVPDSVAVKHVLEPLNEPVLNKMRNELHSTRVLGIRPENSGGDERSLLNSDIMDEKLFRRLATKLAAEWERLATELDCTSANLCKIKQENPYDVENQIFGLLVEWKQRCGRFDEQTLARALERVGRSDLAHKLQENTTSVYERQHVS